MFLSLPVVLFQEACLNAAVKMLRSDAKYKGDGTGNILTGPERTERSHAERHQGDTVDWGRSGGQIGTYRDGR